QCAYLQTERWLALQQARLLACDHSHVIFTLPHDLNPLWLANVPVMSTLLFQVVRETLCDLLADPKSLGAQPGMIAALHTWSQSLVLHPHVHCLVTGGGLTPAGQWVAVRHGFLLPVRVVMAVFRGKMLDALRQAVAQDALGLPEAMRPQPWRNRLNRLGQAQTTPWNVHMRERYRHGAGVVAHPEALAPCRARVGQRPVVVPVALDWQTGCAQRGDVHPERCPACGQLLVYTGIIPRGGAPPPVLSGEHAA